jgi:replication-associated recombination protein RarA
MQLHEQYRPASWPEVVGQDKAIARIDRLRKRGLAGRAFWITGQSGTGKTTIARLIAAEIADETAIEEVDAETVTPQQIQAWERSSHTKGFGKGGRAYIVNEAHGLKRGCIRQLLVTLERIPGHVVWLFTTTCDGQETVALRHAVGPVGKHFLNLLGGHGTGSFGWGWLTQGPRTAATPPGALGA